MTIPEPILGPIVEAIFSEVIVQSGAGEWLREKLGRDPTKRAFGIALGDALDAFQTRHPDAASRLFDASFLQQEARPILAQFLLRNGRPDPDALARAWTDSLRIRDPEDRAARVRELRPHATDFLQLLGQKLQQQPDLDGINDSRAIERQADDVAAIRSVLEADLSTATTRDQYLLWLIERHLYLDTRGTAHSQRAVQVKLDEVYISLQAQRDDSPGAVDRKLLEEELNEIQARLARRTISVEEANEQSAQLLARLHGRVVVAPSAGPAETLELSEAVLRHDRLMVLGDPGCGKTTLASYLALKHAHALYHGRADAGDDLGPARFPILIRIAYYAKKNHWQEMSLAEFLPKHYKLNGCPAAGLADLLQTELARGNCLIILDGLDEIVSGDARRDIIQQIENFVRVHDNTGNRFVVTSRTTGYRSFPFGEPFNHYVVQPMNEGQIRRFLERWCHAVEAAHTPDLSPAQRALAAQQEIDAIMTAIRNSPGVRNIATNPLLLRILAEIKRKGARLPRKRVELYREAAKALAYDWRLAQGVSEADLTLLQDTYLTRLLGRMAYWLHDTEPTGLAGEHQVQALLYDAWAEIHRLAADSEEPDPAIIGKVDQFLLAVREHTGLFVERAHKHYGFMHPTFEEYYAARYMVARAKRRAELIRKHLHDPRWEEPILLALGFVGLDTPADSSELVESAILAQGEDAEEHKFTSSPYEQLLGRDFLFALRCLGDDIPVDLAVARVLIRGLVDELVERRNSGKYQRYRTILEERFLALKETSIAPTLLAELHHVLLDYDADPQLRFNAAQALINMGQHASEDVLTALLNTLTDPDPIVRFNAVHSLINISQQATERVLPALLDALADPDGLVRFNAAQGLSSIGQHAPERVLPGLIAALADPKVLVRRQAVQPLISLSQHALDHVVSSLQTALADPDAVVRLHAAQGLINLGRHDAEQVLATLMTALVDPDADMRRNAAQMLIDLGQIAADRVFQLLADSLSAADVLLRRQVILVLGGLGQYAPTHVIPLLSAALSDQDAVVCLHAAQGLISVDQHAIDQILPLLNHTLGDPDPNLRCMTVQVLIRIGQSAPDQAIPLLSNALNDPAVFVGINAAQGLTSIGLTAPEPIIRLLTKIIEHPESDPNLRWQAVRSLIDLAGHAPERIRDLLSSLLADPESESSLRSQAVQGLSRLAQPHDDSVIAALRSALNDTNATIRWQAAQALTRFPPRSPELMSALLEGLLNANSWELRKHFAVALGENKTVSQAIVDALLAGLLDTHGEVRAACAYALAKLGRSSAAAREEIATKLAAAIADPAFDIPDSISRQSGHEYAFDSLWMLLVGDTNAAA
jgi:HEAT repeat protein